jgi:6-phosphogluconolactonase (cycloisomerase 2 family)
MNKRLLWCLVALAWSSQSASFVLAQAARRPEPSSVVYTLSNEAEGNRVLAFAAAADGSLVEPVAFATEGAGTGDSLGSQAALVLSEDHRFLLAVNAGSSDISVFAVNGTTLSLRDRVSSGGTRPISITERRGLVYVVNAGGVNNVVGFYLDLRGKLHALPGAVRPLSADSAGPGQIELSPDARQLVVTEKTTSKIDVFDVSAFGRLSQAQVVASAGMTPFGFEFTQRGTLIVSEAASASMSSYERSWRDGLRVISAAVPDTQAAPCWVAVSGDDRYAFTANAGSASISSYDVARSGQISLKQARAAELGSGGRPLDLASGRGGRSLYVLDRGNLRVAAFSLASDGTLRALNTAGTLPPFTTGLAAY